MESRITIGPGLCTWELMRFLLVGMNIFNKTKTAFSYIVGSLYFRIICVLVN